MKSKNLAMLLILVLLTFLASCSTRSSPSLPASGGEASKLVNRDALVAKDSVQIEWEKTIIEAKKEGRITVYGAIGLAAARDTLVQAFNERFGITLEMVIAQGPQVTSKLISERTAGLYIADAYMGGADSIISFIPRNIFEPIEPYLILPEVKDTTAWFGGSLPFYDKQRLFLLATLALIPGGSQAINISLLKPEEFTSFKDLLKPKVKGLIAMFDPTIAGASWVPLANKLMGEDYLRELVKQDVVITRDFRLMTEWIARGKYPLGLGVDTGSINILIKDGAPISILPPFKEGVDLGPAGGIVAVIDKNPHPNATRVFVNWILSKEGQTILSRKLGIASRRLDVPVDHLAFPWLVPDPKVKYIIQDEDYSRYKIQMMEVAKEIFAPLLK